MLQDKEINITISYRNITHYKKLGYDAILKKDLKIKTEDLSNGSHVLVIAICELCKKETNLKYHKYVDNRERYGFYGCKKCSRQKFLLTLININGKGKYFSKTYDKDSKEISNLVVENSNYSKINFQDMYIDITDGNYLNYRNEVRKLTRRNKKELFKNWNGLDYYDGENIKDNFNLPHIDKNYPTIDHKISIYYGYKNGITPEIISSFDNLCITKHKINSTKRDLLEFEFTKN